MADSFVLAVSVSFHKDVSSIREEMNFSVFFFLILLTVLGKLSNKYLFINTFKKYSLDSFLNLLNGIGFRSSTSRN